MKTNILFITGTDTNSGKTLLTALLLNHLRQSGQKALASKPFCSGSREDVQLLQSLQSGELDINEANPWFFEQPVAPWVALRSTHTNIPLSKVTSHIQHLAQKCDTLLVEGSGGLMVPLGKGYTVLDLIQKLRCHVVLAARNQLGCINHTLLSIHALKTHGIRKGKVILMGIKNPDISCQTNARLIREAAPGFEVIEMPFLGSRASSLAKVRKMAKAEQQTLKQVFEC